MAAHVPTHVPTSVAPVRHTPVTRVLIVDDHPVVRKGIRLILRSCSDMEVVGEAGSGEEALRVVDRLRPKIIVTDLMMPGMDGIATIRALRECAPQARIVVLTNLEAGDLVQEALKAGATAYYFKRAAMAVLIQAIRSAAQDQMSLDPEAALALAQATKRGHTLGHDLTKREHDVLGLLVQGLSNAAMAAQLVVSVATVKFHLHSIGRKLGARSRTKIVAVALHHHLIATG